MLSSGRRGAADPRGDEAELFRRHAGRLIADTRRSVKTSPALIEDGCAFAWVQLLRYQPERDILPGRLRKTAGREALRLVAAGRRVASPCHPRSPRTGAVERGRGGTTTLSATP